MELDANNAALVLAYAVGAGAVAHLPHPTPDTGVVAAAVQEPVDHLQARDGTLVALQGLPWVPGRPRRSGW